MAEWSFITNHGRVIGYIYRNPRSTAREIASAVGITERTTHNIIADLADSGYITRRKKGRRNIYKVEQGLPAVTDTNRQVIVGDLLSVVRSKKGMRMARIRTTEMMVANGYSGQMKLLID
ncbi:MAG: MarR family transcriptional regulator [Dehalococcoidia bacterium]|nr:MarR family transcriptional regulator [Dehalococcoidia bacterium]